MDAELEKLVESGKLTTKAAEQLRPGSFCLHKSWGFGQVAEWNLLLNQIVIDFKTKAKHPMQLAYGRRPFPPARARRRLARRKTFTVVFYGSKIFCCKTAQLSETRVDQFGRSSLSPHARERERRPTDRLAGRQVSAEKRGSLRLCTSANGRRISVDWLC
jgi:hypothetical protein